MYNPQLDTFVAVAEQGSFSKAAEQKINARGRRSRRLAVKG